MVSFGIVPRFSGLTMHAFSDGCTKMTLYPAGTREALYERLVDSGASEDYARRCADTYPGTDEVFFKFAKVGTSRAVGDLARDLSQRLTEGRPLVDPELSRKLSQVGVKPELLAKADKGIHYMLAPNARPESGSDLDMSSAEKGETRGLNRDNVLKLFVELRTWLAEAVQISEEGFQAAEAFVHDEPVPVLRLEHEPGQTALNA